MSKRFQLPTQKGMELFPKTTQQPTKLVIRGVPPGPLSEAVANAHGGNLKRFHAKAQHTYALSDSKVMKFSKVIADGVTATYSNQFGSETLELDVTTAASATVEEELAKKIYPDFAVIDIVVKNTNGISFFFAAALISPNVSNNDPAFVIGSIPNKNDGFEHNVIAGIEYDGGYDFDYSDGVDLGAWKIPKFIEYADPYLASDGSLPGISSRVSSLKVDFRPFADAADVVVDLYYTMGPTTETIQDPPVFIGWTTENIENLPHWGIFGFDHSDPAELTLPNGDPNPDCLTHSVQMVELSSVLSGAPNPVTIEFVGALGGTQASDSNSPTGPRNYAIVDYLQPQFPQIYPDNFVRVPPEGYVDVLHPSNKIYDSIHQGTWIADFNYPLDFSVPEPYHSEGYDWWQYWYFNVYENTLYYDKQPVYDYPSHNAPVERDADMTFAFYESGTKLIADLLPDSVDEECAMWVVKEGEEPKRTQFTTVHLDGQKVDAGLDIGPNADNNNPRSYIYLGRLTVDRATRSIGWKPAT